MNIFAAPGPDLPAGDIVGPMPCQERGTVQRRCLWHILAAFVWAFPFAGQMSAHDKQRVVLYLLNQTFTEGNMCVNGLRVRRHNETIGTLETLGNLLCEDDILQRIPDPKGLIAVWFVGAEGTKTAGYGAVKIIRLGDTSLGVEGGPFREQTWAIHRADLMPIRQLIEQTHVLLKLRGGDFKFEPAVEIDNFSSTIRQVLLEGHPVASVPPGENYAICQQALAAVKVPYTVTVLYGKGHRADGGKSVIYRSAQPAEWKLTPRLISTEAEAEWDEERYYPAGDFEIEVENKAAAQAVVAIDQKKAAVVPLDGKYRIARTALAGAKPSITVNVVYLAGGIPQGGPFRVYWKERLARTAIGPLRAIDRDGAAQEIDPGDAGSKPAGPEVVSAWTLVPN